MYCNLVNYIVDNSTGYKVIVLLTSNGRLMKDGQKPTLVMFVIPILLEAGLRRD